MSIHLHHKWGFEDVVLWGEEGSQQVLAPRRVVLTLEDEPELSPFPLELGLVLVEDHYAITYIEVLADRRADTSWDDPIRERANYDDRLTPATKVPPITAGGLTSIRLPEIMREGLKGEGKVRRWRPDGSIVTGIGREDEVPVVYVLAKATGYDPTKAVAEHLGISRGAAAQRVARARQAGLLPPTTKGAR